MEAPQPNPDKPPAYTKAINFRQDDDRGFFINFQKLLLIFKKR